jgi:hypothetical protein
MKKWLACFGAFFCITTMAISPSLGNNSHKNSIICYAEQQEEKDHEPKAEDKKNNEFDFIQKNEPTSAEAMSKSSYMFYGGIGLICLGSAGVLFVAYSLLRPRISKWRKNKS